MSMLGHQDGDSNASYLEIVDFISAYGANPDQDAREL